MATLLTDLGDELLAHVLVFSAPRDVEALTVASRLVAREVVPRFPAIWKAIFRRRWEALNFQLVGVAQGTTTLEINEHLHALFPRIHCCVPSESHPIDFALDGGILGKDRCVRANVPFPTTFHVAVFKRRSSHHGQTTQSQPGYEIGVVPGAYFEGRLFGPSFSAGHTVGCGIRVNPETDTTFVFFTREGELVDGEVGVYVECEHREWYPAVGLDSYDALHLNFGQEPFKYDDIADELFEECEGMAAIVSQQLQWNDIRDSDGESSSEGEQNQDEDESVDNEFDSDSDSDVSEEEIGAALIMRILAMRRAGAGDIG
ncbi:hypothetical protein BBJ28_00006559 [Nothophytophthora sp. Chile5]|nr:hypothetical protein BBJ28_00006559 [Nothophytophthora sp. Chile5]